MVSERAQVEAEGFAARMVGRLFHECPYSRVTHGAWRRAWQDGWMDADWMQWASRPRRHGRRRRIG